MSAIENNGNNIPKDQVASNVDETTHYILKALESQVNVLKNEIDVSQSMLPLGVETDLTSFIKKTVQNPLSHLLVMRNDLDSKIGSFITLAVKKFFETHADKIQKAFRTDTGLNTELHYSIVLNEDNSENRKIILSFLRDYKG